MVSIVQLINSSGLAITRKLLQKFSATGLKVSTAFMCTKVDAPPRPVRGEPGKVVLGLIPVEWCTFFHRVTGVSGFYTFCFTVGIFLASKEKLVMEHEYYGGLSTVLLWYLVATKAGPKFGKSVDKEIDEYEAAWNQGRKDETAMLEDSISDEIQMQSSSEGQMVLVEAKRENVALQLEANFRERQMDAYKRVKGMLDYQVEVEQIKRRIAHKNMVIWVTDKVMKSITPEEEAKNILTCIDTLASVAKKPTSAQNV